MEAHPPCASAVVWHQFAALSDDTSLSIKSAFGAPASVVVVVVVVSLLQLASRACVCGPVQTHRGSRRSNSSSGHGCGEENGGKREEISGSGAHLCVSTVE